MLSIAVNQFHMINVPFKKKNHNDFIGNVGLCKHYAAWQAWEWTPECKKKLKKIKIKPSTKKIHRHRINGETYTHRCRNGLFPFWSTPSSTEGETVGLGHNLPCSFLLKGQFLYMLGPFTVNEIHVYMVHSGLFYRHPSVLVDRCQGTTRGLREGHVTLKS